MYVMYYMEWSLHASPDDTIERLLVKQCTYCMDSAQASTGRLVGSNVLFFFSDVNVTLQSLD